MKTIYLDYNATGPVDPLVLDSMLPYLKEVFGNPTSQTHSFGWEAETAVEKSRQKLALLMGCDKQDVFFTSSATESNNWVITGLVKSFFKSDPIHVISTEIEHKSVLEPLAEWLALGKLEVTLVKPNRQGLVDPQEILRNIRSNTKLVSVIWVQNEIGTVQPVHEISEIARNHNAFFHTDATQAIGKIPLNLQSSKIDFLSLSGHKMYAPKGVGALFSRPYNSAIKLHPLLLGGGQESSMRSGTLNVPGIVGLGTAAELALKYLPDEPTRLQQLRDFLFENLKENFPNVELNGDLIQRAPNNLNLYFKNYRLPAVFNGLAVSQSSACSSGVTSTSHVLQAIGLNSEQAQKCLRLSLGRFTTKEDLLGAVEILKKSIVPLTSSSLKNF
jgi:cysteine desulfurase